MTTSWLGLLLLLHAVQQIGSAFLLFGEYEFIVWDITNVVSVTLLSYLLFRNISYRSPRRKLTSFIFLLVSSWSAASYAVITLFQQSLLIFSICFFVSMIPFFFWAAMRDFEFRSDKYLKSCSYLVYSQPIGVVGLIALCVGFRGAGVSLVVNGREFSYSRAFEGWIITEKKHRHQKNGVKYQKIRDVDLAHARELIGKKWHWRKNCLSTFSRYQDRKCPCWWA
jgi:hypothetical protein